MQYYKVNKESDNKYIYINKGNKIELLHSKRTLVANELITIKESKRLGLVNISQHSKLIEVNKNKTYFFFGCRFYKE